MGIVEGLVLWAGISILFCVGIGRLLHTIDHRGTRREQSTALEPRSNVVVLNPSRAHR